MDGPELFSEVLRRVEDPQRILMGKEAFHRQVFGAQDPHRPAFKRETPWVLKGLSNRLGVNFAMGGSVE